MEQDSRTVIERFIQQIRRTVPGGGGPLVVGVSGGADSTALLRALCLALPDHRERLHCMHCNYRLRGEESERDCRFVTGLCHSLGVRLHVEELATLELQRPGEGLEEACRRLRYSLFRQMRTELGAARILVAHNADDNVETFLLNLMRGAGLRGLAAMPLDTGELLRPLLPFHRSEILEFLEALGQDHITDSSNADTSFSRNFIRGEVLPLLESRWPAARRMIVRSQQILQSEEQALLLLSEPLEGERLPWPDRSDAAPAMLRLWLRGKAAPSAVQLQEMAASACARRTGSRWDFPEGTVTAGSQGFLWTAKEPDEAAAAPPPGYGGRWVTVDEGFRQWMARQDASVYIGTADITGAGYRWDFPTQGEKMQPLGMAGRRSLVSKILKDSGVPAPIRSRVAMLKSATTGEILWIPGLRRSCLENISEASERAFVFGPAEKLP